MSETAAVNIAMRKLRKLSAECGGARAQEAGISEVDTSQMTPYEAEQFRIADRMRIIRTFVTELDALPVNTPPSRRVQLSNQIRKEEQKIKQSLATALSLAKKEKKQTEYDVLIGHFKKTQELVRHRSSAPTTEGLEMPQGPVYGAVSPTQVELLDSLPSGGYNIRSDEEFVQFFAQVQENDVRIDQALDRIHLGVQRLAHTASSISAELKVQDNLLDDTEAKVDKATASIKGLNRKLKETLREVDKDKFCLYIFCCFILLGLAGGIYYAVKTN
jgi:hypothetical protein